MSAIYRMGVVAVLMLALLTPAMACVLPSYRPAAEAACCKRMNGDCSTMHMPVSQCCQMKARTGHIALAQPQSMAVAADTTEVAAVPVPVPSSTPHAMDRRPRPCIHPVPILRI